MLSISTSAASPATCGVAIDVPWEETSFGVPGVVVPPLSVEATPLAAFAVSPPGAVRSTIVPSLEYDAPLPSRSLAATTTVLAHEAGW